MIISHHFTQFHHLLHPTYFPTSCHTACHHRGAMASCASSPTASTFGNGSTPRHLPSEQLPSANDQRQNLMSAQVHVGKFLQKLKRGTPKTSGSSIQMYTIYLQNCSEVEVQREKREPQKQCHTSPKALIRGELQKLGFKRYIFGQLYLTVKACKTRQIKGSVHLGTPNKNRPVIGDSRNTTPRNGGFFRYTQLI